jgi:hypothetical protein
MSNLIHKFVGNRTRTKQTRRDEKIDQLYRVGAALLAEADYEGVSVARLARDAKVSVGAFYGRFPPSMDGFRTRTISSDFSPLGPFGA